MYYGPQKGRKVENAMAVGRKQMMADNVLMQISSSPDGYERIISVRAVFVT